MRSLNLVKQDHSSDWWLDPEGTSEPELLVEGEDVMEVKENGWVAEFVSEVSEDLGVGLQWKPHLAFF